MGLYLGVDAGGTRTTFLLADGHRELARTVVGTIKRMRADAGTTAANLEQALAELTLHAGIPMSDVTCTCVGAAGYTVPYVVEWLRDNFHSRVGGRFLLAGDVEIALDAAFQGQPGLLLLSGTGSNVAGRLYTGEIVTAGGWGPALSDQASGYGIGRAGLRAAVLEHDEKQGEAHGGQEPSALLRRILTFWNLADFQAVVDFGNRQPPPDLSQLAPLVVAAALAGDPVALAVIARESADLAHLGAVILRRVRSSGATGPLGVAFAGSIMEHVPLVRDHVTGHLHQADPHLAPLTGVVDPVQGALWRARHSA